MSCLQNSTADSKSISPVAWPGLASAHSPYQERRERDQSVLAVYGLQEDGAEHTEVSARAKAAVMVKVYISTSAAFPHDL